MNRLALCTCALMACSLAACGEERRVIRDNSAESKFTGLFANDPRWQITGPVAQRPAKEGSEAMVIKDAPNNFANLKITTSFQPDPRMTPPPNPADPNQNVPELSTPDPWLTPLPPNR